MVQPFFCVHEVMSSDLDSAIWFSEISGDHHLKYGVRVLGNAHYRELAVEKETEYIWGNPKHNEFNPLTLIFLINCYATGECH